MTTSSKRTTRTNAEPAATTALTTIEAVVPRGRGLLADLHLDDGSVVTLAKDTLDAHGLFAGRSVPAADFAAIREADERSRALAAAVRLLSVRARSRKDLGQRLKRRGFRTVAVDAALTRLEELGYLNDAAFAKSWVEARQAATPRSRRALQFELTRNGVGRELAAEAVSEVSDSDAAYDAASRRLRSLRNLDEQTFRRRLGSFLTSRGFAYGSARGAIDRCWRELHAGDDD
jgi:regulatory protein